MPTAPAAAGFAIWLQAGASGLSSTGALDVAVEVAMIFQLRPTTTGASLRWHRDVSWVCGGCTATPGASRRRKTQVPARVLCLSGSCRLSHAEKHGSQRAKVAAVPARAGQMKVSHVWEFSRARSASRRTRTGPRQPRAWAHLGTGLHLSHFCRRYTNVVDPSNGAGLTTVAGSFAAARARAEASDLLLVRAYAGSGQGSGLR